MLFNRGPWWELAPVARIRLILDMDKRMSSLGSIEQVKKKIEEIFPEVCWTQMDLPSNSIPPSLTSFNSEGPVWFGKAGVELQLDQNEIGEVQCIQMSRAEPAEVRKLKKSMRLISMSLDTDSFIGILFS